MNSISWEEFALIGLGCALTILVFRTAPLFLLRGKELPGWLSQALAFIPPAAFAALIANDILSPTMFDAGIWPGLIPLIGCCGCHTDCAQDKVVGVVYYCGSRVLRTSFADINEKLCEKISMRGNLVLAS